LFTSNPVTRYGTILTTACPILICVRCPVLILIFYQPTSLSILTPMPRHCSKPLGSAQSEGGKTARNSTRCGSSKEQFSIFLCWTRQEKVLLLESRSLHLTLALQQNWLMGRKFPRLRLSQPRKSGLRCGRLVFSPHVTPIYLSYIPQSLYERVS